MHAYIYLVNEYVVSFMLLKCDKCEWVTNPPGLYSTILLCLDWPSLRTKEFGGRVIFTNHVMTSSGCRVFLVMLVLSICQTQTQQRLAWSSLCSKAVKPFVVKFLLYGSFVTCNYS